MPYFTLTYETSTTSPNGGPRTDRRISRRCARRTDAANWSWRARSAIRPTARCWCSAQTIDRTPEQFAQRDPYVLEGLVRRWDVRPWTVVVGNDPSEPPRLPGLPAMSKANGTRHRCRAPLQPFLHAAHRRPRRRPSQERVFAGRSTRALRAGASPSARRRASCAATSRSMPGISVGSCAGSRGAAWCARRVRIGDRRQARARRSRRKARAPSRHSTPARAIRCRRCCSRSRRASGRC